MRICKAPKGSRARFGPASDGLELRTSYGEFREGKNPQFHELGQISRESVKFESARTTEFSV